MFTNLPAHAGYMVGFGIGGYYLTKWDERLVVLIKEKQAELEEMEEKRAQRRLKREAKKRALEAAQPEAEAA